MSDLQMDQELKVCLVAESLLDLLHPISDFHTDPANTRKNHDIDRIAGSLQQFGQRKPIVANRKQGNKIEAGNGTYLGAKKLGWTHIAAVFVDDDAAVAAAYGIADNRVGEFSEWDLDVLRDVAGTVEDLFTGFKPAELADLIGGDPPPDDPGAQIDRAEELRIKWGVKSGQLWQLGDHRLICGDCTDRAVVERVMGGEKAALLVTDPPYNVDKDYGNEVDDLKSKEEYRNFLETWFALWSAVSERQIVTIGRRRFEEGLWFGLPLKATGCWTKINAISRGRITQSSCWEPIIFAGEKWNRTRPNDVFNYPVGMQGHVGNHPCPKPLKLWTHLIEQYSIEGDIIADAFDGSGTTIVACEQTKRIARASELEPKYIAVALERWAQMTGKTPELVAS